ncbi:MAG: serine protease Do [Patiriisocius sp.]|jgi:serine protease Do
MNAMLKTVSIALFGGLVALGGYKLIEKEEQPSFKDRISAAPVHKTNMPAASVGDFVDLTGAAETSLNTVVHIKTQYQTQYQNNPWFEMLGQMPGGKMMQSSGSGVILSQDGYVVTNHHVIENATKIQVTLNDNRSYTAELIGSDPAYDLALLKIDDEDLPFSTFGDSESLRIGEWVLAVGNPFNLTSTVTAGIVSAKARNINILEYDPNKQIFPVESFIQTDAAVNPGNSGGALVNTRGELVGINTAIASRTGSYSGYSFAVPSSIVQKVIHDLLEYGKVERAYIGVEIANLNQELADRLNISDVKGVYVSGVIENSAADEGGIFKGDIITEIDGNNIGSFAELQGQVSKYHPGDEINISIKRDNKELSLDVILQDRLGNKTVANREEKSESLDLSSLGAKFSPVSKEELQRLGIARGVQITDLNNGPLLKAGIKEGLIITKIDKQEIANPNDVVSLLGSKEGGVLIEGIYPNGTTAYYGFGI